MDDYADRSGGDNVRLSVSIDDHDYDIRSDARVDGGDKDKVAKLDGDSGGGDDAAGEVSEGKARNFAVITRANDSRRGKARFPLPKFTARIDGPWTRVHFLTPVNSGIKNAPEITGRQLG